MQIDILNLEEENKLCSFSKKTPHFGLSYRIPILRSAYWPWTCLFSENSAGVQHEPLRDPQGSYSAVWAVTPVSLLGRPTVIPRHLHELGDRLNLTLEG